MLKYVGNNKCKKNIIGILEPVQVVLLHYQVFAKSFDKIEVLKRDA